MAGAEERRRFAARDGFGGHLDRRARLAPKRRRGRLRHRHHLGRVDDAHARRIDVRVAGQLRFERGRRPHERHAEIEVAHGGQRTVDDVARREVAAHRVNCNLDHVCRRYFSSTARTWRPP
jgi:hypothetical protein